MDIAIPVSLDAADADGSMCLDADVQQGDSTLQDRGVTVSLEQSASGAVIHVRSASVIEEPVVTLRLRAGCNTTTNRNFTLLADIPTGGELPTAVLAPVPVPSAALQAQRAASRQGAATGGNGGLPGRSGAASGHRSGAPASDRDTTTAGDSEAPRPRRPAAEAAPSRPRTVVAHAAPRPAPAAAPAPAPAVQAPAPDAAAGKSRLHVDALDPATAAVGSLKPTTELNLPAAPDPARRAAAAELWSALDPNAAQSAAEAKREGDRIKELETTLAALREQSAQNQRTLLEMRSELAEARDSRYRNPLVYALLGLLLLALIALLMLWRLASRAAAPAWWREAPPTAAGGTPTRPRTQPGKLDGNAAAEEDDPPVRRGEPPRIFVPTPFAPLEPNAGAADSTHSDLMALPLPPTDGAPVRPVNTEELFDVQQQSDFFLSLGQHEQAISVLREHIEANPGTSALAYLDLLRIYHALDRKDEYARLAEEFERAFNADVPEFDQFNETGRGLEHYRDALSRIEALWPTPASLSMIEELVFRRPGGHGESSFDLPAYQELLLLYSVAKEVIDPQNAAPPASAPAAPEAPVPPVPAVVADAAHPTSALVPPAPAAEPTLPNSAFVPTPFPIGGPAGGPVSVAPRDWSVTQTAPLELVTAPDVLPDGPVLPPSLYGSIDEDLEHQTVMSPDIPPAAQPAIAQPPATPEPDIDLGRFDRTAYETLPAPIEPPPAQPEPASDPHVVDFELFDPATEAEIAPRPPHLGKR